MRISIAFVAALAGCGDGGPTADPYSCMAAGGASCFELPTNPITAADALGRPAQPALDCGPYEVRTSAVPVTLAGTTRNAFDRRTVPLVHVEAFADLAMTSFLGEAISDEIGEYSLTISAMPSQVFLRTTATGALPMRVLYQRTDVAVAQHDRVELVTASRADVASALELVGDTFARGKSQVTGTAYDCNGNRLVNVIANIAPTSAFAGARTFEPGVRIYYAVERTSPALARRTQLAQTSTIGSFTATNVAAGRHYVQLWGFGSESAMASGEDGLELLGEAEILVPETETALLLGVHASSR